LAALVTVLALSLNSALDGRFISNTVFANLNPYSPEKMFEHVKFAVLSAGPLMLVAAAGARPAIRAGGRALFVYLGFAVAEFLVTASKIGSDLNYQIESTIVLILCVSMALHALDFFNLSFANHRTWITLLQLPLAVFLVVNCRITLQDVMVRFSSERMARSEIARLRPWLSDGGHVLSADYNALVRLRGRMDVEMLIYKLLVDARLVNPEPVRKDIASSHFSTIVLMEDVNHPDPAASLEISTLPAAQIEEVRRHYTLVEQIPVPGVYVYKPLGRGAK